MADTAAPGAEPGLEPRVARLEADVAHIRGDIADIKGTLARLAPLIDELRGVLTATLPTLATKAEPAQVATPSGPLHDPVGECTRIALKSEMAALLVEIRRLPTRRQSIFDKFAVVSLVGIVLAVASYLAN